MKIQHFFRLSLFLFVLGLLGACGSEKKAEKVAQNLSVEEVKIVKKKKKIFLSPRKELLTEGDIVLEVTYPQFKSSDTTQNPTSLNQMIKAKIDSTLARFVSQGQGIDANANEKTDTVMVKAEEVQQYKGNATAAGRSLYSAYKIHRSTPDYVEVELGMSEFTGGAHGQSYTTMYHYDVASGKDLSFSDLFAPNSDFVNQVSKMATNELMAKKDQIGTDSAMVYTGAGANEANFKNFSTLSDTLSLLFDPYAVAPYAAGPQVVKIPFSKLESILNKNSVILKSK